MIDWESWIRSVVLGCAYAVVHSDARYRDRMRAGAIIMAHDCPELWVRR